MFLRGKCGYCDYMCERKDIMGRHVKEVHYREKNFHCQLCPLQVSRKDKLRRHMETMHSSDKPYKCDLCSSSFNRKDKLKVHTQHIHFGIKPEKKIYKKSKKGKNSTVAVPNPQRQTLQPQQINQNVNGAAVNLSSGVMAVSQAITHKHDHFMFVPVPGNY